MKPHCPSCIHFMQSASGSMICRRNGRDATPDNAETCEQFVREPGSDDETLVWFDGAWVVDAPQDL